MGKVICVTNEKGGVGKTTLSINLARGLNQSGYKVLVIDADKQANSTDTLDPLEKDFSKAGMVDFENNVKEIGFWGALEKHLINSERQKTLGTVLKKPRSIREAIIKTQYNNLDLLSSSLEQKQIEIALMTNPTGALTTQLALALEEIKNDYDYIIIDNPPEQDIITTNTIIASDLIIIPVTSSTRSLKGLILSLKNIIEIQNRYHADFDFKILMSMKNRNNDDTEIEQIFKKYVPQHIFNTSVRYQSKPMSTASKLNKFTIDSKANVSNDLNQFVKEVIQYFDQRGE